MPLTAGAGRGRRPRGGGRPGHVAQPAPLLRALAAEDVVVDAAPWRPGFVDAFEFASVRSNLGPSDEPLSVTHRPPADPTPLIPLQRARQEELPSARESRLSPPRVAEHGRSFAATTVVQQSSIQRYICATPPPRRRPPRRNMSAFAWRAGAVVTRAARRRGRVVDHLLAS